MLASFWTNAPRRRIARYSVAAIFVALIGVVFICVWILLMALQWGGATPTVFFLPPWVPPAIMGIAVFVLLWLHWGEVASAERDRRLRDRRPGVPEEAAESRFALARSGFRHTLSPVHKAHTIASNLLFAIVIVSLIVPVVL
jgi:hypothetical protein